VTNTSLPVVVVSQRVDHIDARLEHRDALDQRLIAWLLRVGVLPVPVPNQLGLFDASLYEWLAVVKPSGVVLSGGNDLGEFPARDATELGLIKYAASKNLPLLGVCRGMQMLAHVAGVALNQIEGHVATRHRLRVVDSQGGWPTEVNSYHQFSLSACPTNYVVAAFASTGEIEAMRHLTLPWEGWMWHPEREEIFSEIDIHRLKTLFNVK
jgi:putative glutamine amidotransferase